MSHVRQQIREAFGTACTGLTTTGSNVFQSRSYPLETADLPEFVSQQKRNITGFGNGWCW